MGQGLYEHLLGTHWMLDQAAGAFAHAIPAVTITVPIDGVDPCSFCSENPASRKPPRFSGLGRAPPFGSTHCLSSSHHSSGHPVLQLGRGPSWLTNTDRALRWCQAQCMAIHAQGALQGRCVSVPYLQMGTLRLRKILILEGSQVAWGRSAAE